MSAPSPIVVLAHFPISSPARKLSVAKVASTVSAGSNGVSSVITSTQAARAGEGCRIGGRDENARRTRGSQCLDRLDLGFRIAIVSAREGGADRTPSSSALSRAASTIVTKNVLDSVLTISPTIGSPVIAGAANRLHTNPAVARRRSPTTALTRGAASARAKSRSRNSPTWTVGGSHAGASPSRVTANRSRPDPEGRVTRFDATHRRPVGKWTAAPRLTTSPQGPQPQQKRPIGVLRKPDTSTC